MTHNNRVRMSKLTLGLLAVLAAAPAFAQSTSAGVGGRVVGADGQPVQGAEVTIVHTESGTVSRAVTGEDGRYNARGLRVGGPYTITINKAGAGTASQDEVYLPLNQVATVDSQLNNDVTTLASVQAVVGLGSEVFSANKMGTGSNVTRETIEALPSANRNIQDYIRLDPRISQVSKADGAISAGGQNTRYNAIRIDGVSTNDPFGLESNNLPTERQPVSMDAIQEINIDLANYDTTINGGTGAVINAVTKSGTNEYHGTAYYTVRDKDWVREDLRGVKFNGFDKEETYGATFGGPIIKDKLFFFGNYEKYTRTAPGVSLADGPYGRGLITDANIAEAQGIAQGYGFDAGALSLPGNNKTEIEEYALKLDWNINENHRAALRYSKLEQSVLRFPLISNSQVSLSSSWYALPKTFESTVAELFSDWSDNFSTEFKASYRDYTAVRDTFSNLPQIRINFGNQALYFGTEQNSHVNIIETKESSLFGAGTWYVGDHAVKFGADYQKNDILNFFGRNLNGVYEFQSLAAFRAGTPSRYIVRGPTTGGSIADIPANYTLENTGLFLQDTWSVNQNLTVTGGVRVDIPSFSEQRLFNQRIQTLYGYDNTNTVDDKLIQPRFGFNYTFDSDRPTQVRGGIGLFGGAAPNVWLAGTYQNTGLNYVEYDLSNPGRIFTPNVNPPYYPTTGPSSARQNVDIAEPGLKLPSVWKANLAFDHELPWWGVVASAELLLTDVKDGIFFQRLDVSAPTAVGPDGRLNFWNAAGRNPANGRISGGQNFGISQGTGGATAKANRPSDIGDVILMRNTNKGKSQQFTIGLDKPLGDMWGWSLAYTHTVATEVSPLTSSQNTSNWGNTLAFQANEEVAYNSRYALRDRFTGTMQWKHNFFGNNATRAGLFYEGRTGRPFSYIFYNDANGDGAGTNDLFYVPENPGDVVFTGGAAMEQSFFNFLAANPELQRYRGQVAPANAFRAQWTNNFDVRISQELPGFMRGHKAELSFDIMNVGNLINKNWGLVDDYGFFSTRRVANYVGICGSAATAQCPAGSAGKYVYSFTGNTDNSAIQENNNDKGNTGVSRWSLMVGFKYKF